MDNIISIEENLKARGIDFRYYDSRDVLISDIQKITRVYNSVGIGNSKTLKALDISNILSSEGKVVYDKTLCTTKEESKHMKKLSLTSDCYISSCNALSMDGTIVNIDHSGNRVAAITYGPDKVILVVGKNKIVDTEKDAINRALKVATPLNAKRAGIKSPCSEGKSCSECTSELRVCNYVSIIRGQNDKDRMIVMLLEEELGF